MNLLLRLKWKFTFWLCRGVSLSDNLGSTYLRFDHIAVLKVSRPFLVEDAWKVDIRLIDGTQIIFEGEASAKALEATYAAYLGLMWC